jgi:hypothetical protein
VLTAAQIFAKFKPSGMLFEASWTGQAGPFYVRLMKPAAGGLALIGASEQSIQFAVADAPTLAQGDTVTINGKSYKLRDKDLANCSADGSLLAFQVREVGA